MVVTLFRFLFTCEQLLLLQDHEEFRQTVLTKMDLPKNSARGASEPFRAPNVGSPASVIGGLLAVSVPSRTRASVDPAGPSVQ